MRKSPRSSAISAGVSSEDPSSTIKSSQLVKVCARRLRMARRRNDAWLKVGIRTEICGSKWPGPLINKQIDDKASKPLSADFSRDRFLLTCDRRLQIPTGIIGNHLA